MSRSITAVISSSWFLIADACCRRWVEYKRTDPIVKKLMRLLFTGTLDGKPNADDGEASGT